MNNLVFIDARTKHGKHCRITAFSETVEECLKQFKEWILEHDLKPSDIWYSNIYECGTDRHLTSVKYTQDGDIISTPAPENSKLSPYSLSIKQLISYILP